MFSRLINGEMSEEDINDWIDDLFLHWMDHWNTSEVNQEYIAAWRVALILAAITTEEKP